MQSLDRALPVLEELKALVDKYDPIKYESSDESQSLSEQIPQTYGAIQEVYRNYSGDLKIEVTDRDTKNFYHNYFEAGYLSGRTIHSHQGHQELLQMIGRVRTKMAEGETVVGSNSHRETGEGTEDSGSPGQMQLGRYSPSMKERFENHPLIFGISLIIVGFLAGIAFSEWTMAFRDGASNVTDFSGVAAQAESLTHEHNKRLEELHSELHENEQQAVHEGNLDSRQKKHVETAQRIRGSIKEENGAYRMHLEQLMKFVDADGT